jgi:acetyl esterase/lipase
VTFNHRYHDFAQLDQSASDVAAAIRYVRDHAELFNLDSDRLCLWAISGGGPFLSFALRDKPTFVRCIVAYYALLDLRQSKEASAAVSKEALRKFSPVSCLSHSASAAAPIFVARAGLDYPEFDQSIDLFLREALAANAVLDLANHHQGQHGFDLLNDDPRSRWIIARTIEFVKAHVSAD